MHQGNYNEIIVISANKNPLGIVTYSDIIKNIGQAYINPQKTTLEDIMTFPLITIDNNSTLNVALEKMRKYRIRKLVVIKDSKVEGIIYQDTIATSLKNAIFSKSYVAASSLKSILGNLGLVLQFAGVLMVIPAIIATILNEHASATGIFLMTILFLITGFFLNTYGEKHKLNIRGAAILVFLSFLILVLCGSIPYFFAYPYHSDSIVDVFTSSFFVSSAGFTTTGISLIDQPEELPRSLAFYRSYTQFVGGLSFIYLAMTAFFPEGKLQTIKGFISGRIFRLRELFSTITLVFTIYAFLITTLLFFLGDRNLLDNFAFAMSILSTDGFLPDSTIIENLTSMERLVIIGGMILGALPFTFHYAVFRNKFLGIELSREISIFLILLVLGSAIFIILSQIEPIDGIFTIVAISSTTGISLMSFSDLQYNTKVFLIILMIIGGCGFSTAGGIKVFRLISLSNLRKVFTKKLTELDQSSKKELVVALILIVLFPTVPLPFAYHLNNQGHDFTNSYFESVGAITTAGLGTGIINQNLDPLTKIMISFLMILGRLEIIILAYMIVPKLI